MTKTLQNPFKSGLESGQPQFGFTVDNADAALRVGMVASLVVDTASNNGSPLVTVPMGAIVKAPDDTFAVYVVDDGDVAELRSVQAGQILGNRVVVLQGLNAGENVIISGTAQVSDGQAVNIVP